MARKDYFDDPDAPAPNSLVPAVSAVVADAEGRILVHRRSDNELWSIPGGRVEVGESVADALMREVLEETGIEVEPLRVVGIYSDPRAVVAYDDGEVRQQFSICIACRATGGVASADSAESLEVRLATARELHELPMSEPIRRRLADYLEDREAAVLG
jgi:ADP-ribose pyrophosphatase YjhB (NUDIX family)